MTMCVCVCLCVCLLEIVGGYDLLRMRLDYVQCYLEGYGPAACCCCCCCFPLRLVSSFCNWSDIRAFGGNVSGRVSASGACLQTPRTLSDVFTTWNTIQPSLRLSASRVSTYDTRACRTLGVKELRGGEQRGQGHGGSGGATPILMRQRPEPQPPVCRDAV